MCSVSWANAGSLDGYLDYQEAVYNSYAEFMLDHANPWSEEVINSFGGMLPKLTSEYVVGTALNGVFLYTGATHLKYDAYYPKAWDGHSSPTGYTFDVCLGTFETESTYRYHMFSPCILSATLKEVSA